ncbi:MAG: hypothetical protein KAZ30_02040 [Candidatus Magasanikbacteria bacterium]|nr:hypothetical protein [Candidatus Magasanikbacteria bacterium]
MFAGKRAQVEFPKTASGHRVSYDGNTIVFVDDDSWPVAAWHYRSDGKEAIPKEDQEMGTTLYGNHLAREVLLNRGNDALEATRLKEVANLNLMAQAVYNTFRWWFIQTNQ